MQEVKITAVTEFDDAVALLEKYGWRRMDRHNTLIRLPDTAKGGIISTNMRFYSTTHVITLVRKVTSDDNLFCVRFDDHLSSDLHYALLKVLTEEPKPPRDVHKEAALHLFKLLDDIDTASDIAKSDDKFYRQMVERLQRRRFEVADLDSSGNEITFKLRESGDAPSDGA